MEVLKFLDRSFDQIPEAENPAFSDSECLMICKSKVDRPGLSVIHIHQSPAVVMTIVAHVWDARVAYMVANNYPKSVLADNPATDS